MAKSARASSRKAAKTRLRNTVYAPAEQARLERLSQKLRDTINASSTTGDMEVDREGLSHRLPSIPSCPSPPRAITKNRKGGRRDRSISPSPSTFALALASRGEVNGLGGNGVADYSSTIDTNARDESSPSSNGNETSMLNAQGQFFFDLPLPLSLLDEDSSSGDESEDDAFYRTLGLFCSDGILGFGDGTNTIQVSL